MTLGCTRRLKPEDNYDENLKRMTSYCELFFNTITKSIEDCPVFVRHVCEYVQMSAVRKFPESKQIRQNLSAVGSSLSFSLAPNPCRLLLHVPHDTHDTQAACCSCDSSALRSSLRTSLPWWRPHRVPSPCVP